MSLAAIQKVQRLRKIRAEAHRQRKQAEFRKQLKGNLPANDNSILDLQVRVSPGFKRANHFRVYANRLQKAVGYGLRLVFSAPPQHGKTEVTLHGLVWLIINHPGKRHAYITYSQTRARSVARKVRRILKAAGVAVGGNLDNLTLPGGGQCIFTSIDGGITGEPVDGVAIIDDPYKNRKEADSQRRREVVEESYRDAIETRVHPGASIFLLATRWHPQDLSGTLVGEGWEYINLPAIAEGGKDAAPDPNGRKPGEALFPEMWPLEELEKKKAKVLGFTWAALYQGRPRPRGGKVFREVTYYTELPKRFRGAFGLDLAYTEKTSADWSICVEMLRENRTGEEPLFYVVHVDREKIEAPDFADTLEKRRARRKGFKMLWRASGTEKGAATFMIKDRKLPIEVQQPPGDKLVSATPAAAAWNQGRILLPDPEHFPEAWDEETGWAEPFLGVVGDFTGSGKEVDDDVDGLGNAFTALDEPDMVSAMEAWATRNTQAS